MTRKIAFGVTLVATVLLMLITLQVIPLPFAFIIGSMTLETAEMIPYVVALIIAIIALLCVSRRNTLYLPQGARSSVIGWFSTFTGAIMILLLAYETFCKIAYPSNVAPDNTFDTATAWLMLLFGLAGGVMLCMQGFRWMAFAKEPSPAVQWLSITPAVWMWFRLARYEISFASTVDISENIFVLTTLVGSSLFFLQFARMIAGIGKPPKTSLVIFALITAMAGIAAAPASIVFMPVDQPLSDLLTVVTDAVIAVFALVVAAIQIFAPAQSVADTAEDQTEEAATTEETSETDDEDLTVIPANNASDENDSLAWTTPPRQTAPVDPPFRMDVILPSAKAEESEEPTKIEESTSTEKVSVDDLLSEIDSL